MRTSRAIGWSEFLQHTKQPQESGVLAHYGLTLQMLQKVGRFCWLTLQKQPTICSVETLSTM